MRGPERREPRRVGESIGRLAAELGLGDLQGSAEVAVAWEEAVGSDVAAHVTPVRVRDGVLVVEADSPAWGSQLRYLGADLARRLNAALGRDAVSDVQVRVHAGRGGDRVGEGGRGRPPRGSERPAP
jgi:predicted nucleic acid-binding Zn ribbon protein